MDFGTLTKEQIDSLFTPVDFGSVTKEQIDSLFNTSQTPVSVPNPVEKKTTQPAQVNRQTIPTLKPNTSSAFKTAKQAEEEKQEEKKQTISRVGYSSNELRDMERAMNARQEADNRRVNAYKDDIAPILGTANRTSPNLTNNARREIEGLEKELKDVSKTVSTGDAAVDEAANSLNKEKAGEIKRKISKIKKDGHASNEDYVVSKDKYNALTSDPELKKDIENLGKIEYRSQMAGVTVDPNVYSKTLTGKKLKDYYAYLTKKYGLSKKELKDMALTNQSEERAEKQEEYREKASQYAEEHPVKGSIASLGGTLGSGVEGLYNVAAGAITGDNRYLSNVFNNAKQGLREGAANNFDTGVGKTVYNFGMGLADLGAGVATGNAPLVLAGNTANEAMLSADERGTDTRKAALYGASSGVVDYITNTIGLDKAKSLAMEGIKSSGIKKFLANNAIAGLGEAGENLIQDLAQTALDELINGGNSELSTEYDELVRSGMSKDEALKQTVVDYLKDRAMSAGTGFLMGSAMQGIPTLTSGLYNKHIENNGKKVWNDVEKWENAKLQEQNSNLGVDNSINAAYSENTNGGILDGKLQTGREYDRAGSERLLPGLYENGSLGKELRGVEPERRRQLSSDSVLSSKQLTQHDSVYSDDDINTLRQNKIDSPNFYNANHDARLFNDALETAIANNPNGAAVDPHSVEQIQDIINNGGNVFLVDNATSGYAVEGNGNLTAVFKDPSNNTPGMGSKIALASIKNGATKGDCFGGKLVNMYSRAGFEPVARMKYSEGYNDAMDAQVKEQLEKGLISKAPDVYALKVRDDYDFNKIASEYNTPKQYSQADLDALREFDDYDEMLAYRDSLIKKQPLSKVAFFNESVNADNAEVRDILTGLKNDLQDVYNSQGVEGLRNATNNINSDIPQVEEGTPDIPPSTPLDFSNEPEKIRNTYKNTFVNAGVISPDELDLNPVIRQDSRYTPHKNSVVQEAARQDIEQNGEKWADAYISGKAQINTDSDVDRAMTLLQDYNLSNYEANEIMRNMATNGTKGGQFIQAFDKYVNTAVKAFVDAAKTINDQVKEWKSSNQKTVDRNERIAQILAQEKKPAEYQHIGKHLDEWNNEIDYYTMPENVRNEVKEIYSGMEQLLEAISRAESTEEIDALTHKAIQGMNRAEELLAGNAHLEDTSARQYAKEQIKDFFKKVDGTKIQIPDRIRPEFTDMKIRDFNNAVYFGDKKSHIKFAKESGTPVDQIFEELDNSLNGALSSWCRAEGLNPDIDVNQINAIMGYCNDLKDARKRIDISPYEDYSGISKINKEVHRVANERQKYLDSIAESVDEEIENNSVPMDLQMFGKSKDKSTALQRALKTLEGEPEKVETEPPTTREIRNQVYNTLKDTDAIYDFVDIPNDGTNLKEQEVIRRWLDGEDLSDADKEVVKDLDYIAYMVGHGAGVNELREALNTKFATGTFGVSQETQSKVNRLFDYAKQFDTNSEDFVAAQAEAYRLLANDIAPKASALEKYDAWRYMAMLGNPKTMLRNWLGNKMFGAVTAVSNNVAAWGEERVDNAVKKLNNGQGIQRTKAILNPIEDRGLIDRAKEDARAKRFRQIEGTKYEKMDKDTLKQSRSVWNSKLMQLAEKAVDAGISDTKSVINKYATSLAGYMKANGMDESYFNDGLLYDALKRKADTQLLSDSERAEMNSLKDHVDAMEKARDYALKQAEYSTFHEDNKFAQTLTKWSREARNSDSAAVRGLGYAMEGIVPFKKTPANILRSGIEYSPLGAIKSIKETGKLIYENTGKRKGNLEDTYTKTSKFNGRTKEVNKSLAADVIDSWSKTLTGSALTALGYYLYNKGILHSNDEDTKYQERLEGVQNFSIEINGHTYTIDWMSPGAMPLFLGAEISKVRKSLGKTDEEWYNNIDTYLDAANSILNPIFETSMLSGIQDSLETISRATADKNLGGAIGTVAGNALTGYATQGIPTLGGQIARTIDPERRSTYAENEGILGEFEKQGRKIANKLPFLSKVNQPYINQRGDIEYNSPFQYKEGEPALNALKGVGNFAYQTLSPGYIDKVEHTPADKIGWDVYNDESTANTHQKDKTVFSQYRGSGIKLDGKKLTSKQQTKYERTAYKADDKIRTALANDKWFNSLDSSKKGDVLKDVNTLVGRIGQASVDPKYNTNDKLYNAYKKGGIPTLLAEFQGNNLVKQAGYKSDTKVAEQIQEAVKSGNTEKAMEIVDTSTTLKSLGLDKPYVPITYENAKKQFPDMSVEAFAKQYKQIDGAGEKGKKNQSIAQGEVIAYLNNIGVKTQKEADKVWNAYGSDTWKKIPVLEDGKWVAK